MINHNKTLASCFCGIANQALLTNITAILLAPMMLLYGITIAQFGILIGINFCTQMIADILLTIYIDKIKYKVMIQGSNILSILGLIILGLSPLIMPENPYPIIIVATIIFSFASGISEVVLSPITDTIPDDFKSKKSAMSLMHSFYAWGQVGCILYVSLMLYFFGMENWHYITLSTIAMPIVCMILFNRTTIVQVRTVTKGESKSVMKSPIFYVCCIAIFFGAASELLMNQYVSVFAESSLGLTKIQADLIGMMLFAVCLGLGRVLYGFIGHKVDIHLMLIISSGLAIAMYAIVGSVTNHLVQLIFVVLSGFAVSLLWPGTLVIAGESFKNAGAWIFSGLAIAGDMGAMIFPTIAGGIVDRSSFNMMYLIMTVAPIITFICHVALKFMTKKHNNNDKLAQPIQKEQVSDMITEDVQ